MAPMAEVLPGPSLPKLLALDKRHNNFDERIKEAATLLGISILPSDASGIHLALKLNTSHTRSEFALRWVLEKLKTSEGRKACRSSELVWPFLNQLIHLVSVSTLARLLQASGFTKKIGDYLQESAGALSRAAGATSSSSAKEAATGKELKKSSKKRKRGDKEPSPLPVEVDSVPIESTQRAVLGIISVLRSIITLTIANLHTIDAVSREHIAASLRTTGQEAACILDAWLQCLKHFISQAATNQSYLDAHEAILHVWSSRSCEQNDECGASSKVFSEACLVSLAALLAEASKASGSSQAAAAIQTSLERLLAKHIFVPAHMFYEIAQSSRNPDIKRAQSALNKYLNPIKTTISHGLDSQVVDVRPHRGDVIGTIPQFLDLAIRLCPTSKPAQQNAHIPWLESVFAALSSCAMEPLPHQKDVPTLAFDMSPLITMLDVLKKRSVSFSSEFLESILISYGGLKGLRIDTYPHRFDVVASLLDLNGGIFLKDARALEPGLHTVQASHPPYVEALINSLSEISWVTHDTAILADQRTTGFAVQHLLIPLLRAYNTSRKLPSFISLWFWEIRRQWKVIGTAREHASPWLAQALLQAFQEILETSLSSTRVGELLVEFILPVRQLVDEVTRTPSASIEWSKVSATAPTCAALVILDALLYSIEREETLQQNQVAWLALKDLSSKLIALNLAGFPAAGRAWSIMTRVYKLLYWVEGKEAFLKLQKGMFDGHKALVKAVKLVAFTESENTDHEVLEGEALEAMRFVLTICGFELDASVADSARSILSPVDQNFVIRPAGQTLSMKDLRRLKCLMETAVQYSSLLPLLTHESRVLCFGSVVSAAALEKHAKLGDLLAALIAALVDGEKRCLDDMLEVLQIHATNYAESNRRITDLAHNCLLDISPNLIPRTRREAIIDGTLISWSVEVIAELDEKIVEKGLALLNRLMTCPNPTAQLCTDPHKAFDLASSLDTVIIQLENQGKMSPAWVQSIDALFQRIMQQALGDSIDGRRTQYYNDFKIAEFKIHEIVMAIGMKKPVTIRPVVVLLLKAFLVMVHGLDNTLSASAATTEDNLFVLLEAMASNMAASFTWPWVISRSLAGVLSTSPDGVESKGHALARKLREEGSLKAFASISTVELDSASGIEPKPRTISAELNANLPAQEFCKMLNIFERQTQKLSASDKLVMTADLVASGNTQSLQMLHVLVKSLSTEEIGNSGIGKQVFLQLCNHVSHTIDIGQFGAASSCINTLLRAKSVLVTQHGIDTLLSTLTILSSVQTPALPAEHAGFIYDRLCQLTFSMLLLHRRRLGGRMHLLVALIQNLLSSLFTPHRYYATAVTARPSWLPPTKWLSIDQTISLTRVLTALCSPTVSSTQSHHHRPNGSTNLVDDSKKAKQYAGQYVSYVLLHYCTLQLQGSVAPEVAEKLKIGLWAMMEVVDIEAMRGMNAGMGRGERVVWGALYSEWNRVGRFKLG